MEETGPDWVLGTKRVSVCVAANSLPRAAGLYAVFIDDPGRLPDPFREIAETRAIPHLLYIGQASGSLYQRVWMQEFQHKGPGTLFRSIGVMLGYESPKGGKNFAFTPSDKCAIAAWMAEYLTIAWTVAVRHTDAREHGAEERGAILRHHPLLIISCTIPEESGDSRSYARSRSEAKVRIIPSALTVDLDVIPLAQLL